MIRWHSSPPKLANFSDDWALCWPTLWYAWQWKIHHRFIASQRCKMVILKWQGSWHQRVVEVIITQNHQNNNNHHDLQQLQYTFICLTRNERVRGNHICRHAIILLKNQKSLLLTVENLTKEEATGWIFGNKLTCSSRCIPRPQLKWLFQVRRSHSRSGQVNIYIRGLWIWWIFSQTRKSLPVKPTLERGFSGSLVAVHSWSLNLLDMLQIFSPGALLAIASKG